MNKDELLKIKENALERHIPIIMDDTLEVIDKYLTEKRPLIVYFSRGALEATSLVTPICG